MSMQEKWSVLQHWSRLLPQRWATIFRMSSHCICLCRVCVKQIDVPSGWHPSWQQVIWQLKRKSSWTRRKTLQFGNWQAIVTDRDCMPSMASPIGAKASLPLSTCLAICTIVLLCHLSLLVGTTFAMSAVIVSSSECKCRALCVSHRKRPWLRPVGEQ